MVHTLLTMSVQPALLVTTVHLVSDKPVLLVSGRLQVGQVLVLMIVVLVTIARLAHDRPVLQEPGQA